MYSGYSALHYLAAQGRETRVVEWLVKERGADIHSRYCFVKVDRTCGKERDSHGNLRVAVGSSYFSDNFGNTPLKVAILHKHFLMAVHLVRLGADAREQGGSGSAIDLFMDALGASFTCTLWL